jgi:hypothetical protein
MMEDPRRDHQGTFDGRGVAPQMGHAYFHGRVLRLLCAIVSALHTTCVQTTRMNRNQELAHGCTTSN